MKLKHTDKLLKQMNDGTAVKIFSSLTTLNYNYYNFQIVLTFNDMIAIPANFRFEHKKGRLSKIIDEIAYEELVKYVLLGVPSRGAVPCLGSVLYNPVKYFKLYADAYA